MSPSVKLGLLALVSAAAAVPHVGHNHHHAHAHKARSGFSYPAGGWGQHNGTAQAQPTAATTIAADEKTTEIYQTTTSTQTIVKTIYASRPAGSQQAAAPSVVAGAVDVSTGAAACVPATVYVTATDKVTVTVPPSGAASSAPVVVVSSAAPIQSAAASSSSPAGGYEAPSVVSVPQKGAVTSAAAVAVSSAPAYTPPAAPASSAAASSAVVSSAAPVPSTGSTYSGAKRGLAYNDASLCSAFGDSKFGFSYNWGAYKSGDVSAPFVPMLHSLKPEIGMTPSKWSDAVNTAVKAGSTAIMGFNEPDHAAQANLSPEAACSAWKEYMAPVASAHPGLTIIGPSVTNGPAPMGLDWLQRFQTACPDAKWDAANIHFYDNYDDKVVDRFASHMEQAAKQTGRKIWVTEFGLNPGTATDDQAAAFLKGVMSYMEGSANVQGYSYFMVGTGQYQLLSGSGLSVVGKVYNS